jgi:hypothetical protein
MFKIKYIPTFFFIGLLLTIFPSYGQSQKDSLEYKVDVNFSGRRISGTFSQVVAGGGVNVNLRYKNWHLENTTTYRYNKTNTRLIEDNWYNLVNLKYYLTENKKLYPGAFYFFENNLIYRVKGRHNYGIGLGSVLDKGAMNLSILGAIVQEKSTFNGSEFVNSERDFSNRKNGLFLFRIDNGYSFAKNKINLFYQFFYFQSLKEGADYDLRLNSRISFKLFKGLSCFVVYNYRFENVHLETLSNYNDIVLFGFNWALQG